MVFYTDVIAKSPFYESVSRVETLDLLEPTTRTGVDAIITAAAETDGRIIVPYETYRSQQRQDLLRQTDPALPEKVGAMGYGCGASFGYLTNDQVSQDGDWAFLEALATAAGLIWCGSTGGDRTAVQSVTDEDVVKLQSGTWYPEEAPPPPDTETGGLGNDTTSGGARRDVLPEAQEAATPPTPVPDARVAP
jgi:hypothetical protein